ncbi:BspA family leucine-rich repeat surface protein [Ekhidna sp.]
MINHTSSKKSSQSFIFQIIIYLALTFVMLIQPVSVHSQVPPAPTGLTTTTISNSTVALNWTDNASIETGFKIERSLSADSGFESFAILPANTTSLSDANLAAGTTYHYRVSAITDTEESAYSNVADATTSISETALPYYWSSMDVGSQRLEGSATFEDGFFQTSGNGRMTTTSNSFHFVYQPLQGDGEIIAQLTRMPKANWDHQGVMIRETLDPTASYAMTELYRNNNAAVFKGRSNGEFIYIEDDSERFDIPLWLKMERLGNTFIASVSKNGKDWNEIHRQTISMGENTFVGLVSHASTDDKRSTATWRDVSVSNGASTIAAPRLAASPSPTDEAILSWSDNSANETGFRIERAIKGDTIIFEDLAEVGPNVTSYTDDGLTLGVTYFYRVRALVDDLASFPSNEERVNILKIKNTTLYLQRLAGDYDKTTLNNVVTVSTNADTINNVFRHPGMIGKQIDVSLAEEFSSLNGTLSLKIMPNTQGQTVEFFTSGVLNISQVQDQLRITANGIENIYDVTLDSVTCNHLLFRFNNGVMSPYADGVWFDDVNVGSFNMNSFSLGEFNGNLWDVQVVNDQIIDEIVHDLSARCTSEVEPLRLPFGTNRRFRHCGTYNCLWLTEESQLDKGRKRAYLRAQDIAYDKNTFDIGMYQHSDLDEWVNRERNIPSEGFDYFGLNNIFSKEQGNTSYWLHENFHSYQVPLEKGGKWLAEASANWATWNYYKEPLRGIARYTLDPHLGILESQAGEPFARFYQSSILLSYLTYFVSDEAFMGRLYNTRSVEQNAVNAINTLLAEEGHDFDQIFAEFAARTVVWDYTDSQISEDFKESERSSIAQGSVDNRFGDVLTETGTYGVFTRPLEAFLPSTFYAWNTHKIDSAAASTYTLKLTGSTDNVQGTEFVGKVVTGTSGSYTYHDIPVSSSVALGVGEAQIDIDVNAGEELYLLVVTTSSSSTFGNLANYQYAIKSSVHTLPNDHMLTFELDEETRRAVIDHENLTISAEVLRGTNPTSLRPTITLSDGATSDPAVGASVDFTNPVTYNVTGPGATTPKEWIVSVAVVPPRTGTDFLTFELQDLVPFSSIDEQKHIVSANLINDIDLTNVVPVFTLSDGATSEPASGVAVDLSSPITYTITAEDGTTTQAWVVSAQDFDPFITTWKTESNNEEISLSFSGQDIFDFDYIWKNANGDRLASGSFSNQTDGNTLAVNFSSPGNYSLEIIGAYPNFRNVQLAKLVDVNQWGDIQWKQMALTFAGWEGETFSATDQPDLRKVTSMFGTFKSAENFNGDLSQWDVSNVTGMSDMFRDAKAFNGDLSQWDVSKVTSMEEMFRGAIVFDSDISRWDVSSLTKMYRMFFSARSFDRSLGYWDVTQVSEIIEALPSLSTLNYDRTLIGWSKQDVRSDVILEAGNRKFCASEEARAYLINEKGWKITDGGIDCPEGGESNIVFFELDEQLSSAIIDDENHTIFLEAITGSPITALRPKLILSRGATSVPASETELDFTEPVTFTVTALDGTTTQDWVVTIEVVEIPLAIENQTETIRCYPNPTLDGYFIIESPSVFDPEVEVKLYNLSGSEVRFKTSKIDGRRMSVSFDGPRGAYIAHIRSNGKTQAIKVLKE